MLRHPYNSFSTGPVAFHNSFCACLITRDQVVALLLMSALQPSVSTLNTHPLTIIKKFDNQSYIKVVLHSGFYDLLVYFFPYGILLP